jgi:hypothetical protein
MKWTMGGWMYGQKMDNRWKKDGWMNYGQSIDGWMNGCTMENGLKGELWTINRWMDGWMHNGKWIEG